MIVKLFEEFSENKLGCLLINLHVENWGNIVKDLVEEDDLYKPDDDYGYDKYAHTTILFGLHNYNGIQKDLDDFLPKLEKIDDIKMDDKLSIFENDDFDVVKVNVFSNKMKKLNQKIRKEFKYTNEYDEYSPHMTIAYVKKGSGKKYLDKKIKLPKFVVSDYVYSDPDYKKTKIKP